MRKSNKVVRSAIAGLLVFVGRQAANTAEPFAGMGRIGWLLYFPALVVAILFLAARIHGLIQ